MEPPNHRWQQVVRLFDAAGEIPKPLRDHWLDQECESDPELRSEVASLLNAAKDEEAAAASVAPIRGPEGQRFGPWVAIRSLGAGGMGSVLLVKREDGQFEQSAALKLVAAHLVGEYFLDRLRRERQILANLSHPNITKLIDGGVAEDGVPYLVMEYVDGIRIDQYCDQNRLSLTARLKLFSVVSESVQAAHRNLVAHLDLKPSNILVTADGTPKLLDFGTAKILDPQDGGQTTTRALTPDYASPEQLRGEPVTTSCDVYSLGVILYELLSGASPFLSRSVDSEPRPIAESLSPGAAERRDISLTQLRNQLQGDLSLIVQKALSPDPSARYQSPAALAEDIERYLAGHPVLAQKRSVTYQLTKFARRHRGAVSVTALLMIALIGVGAYALISQRRAAREAERSRVVNSFLSMILAIADPSVAGRVNMSVRELLDVADQYTRPEFTPDAAVRSDIHLLLSNAYGTYGVHDKSMALSLLGFQEAEKAGDIPRQAFALTSLASASLSFNDRKRPIELADRALILLRDHRRGFSDRQAFSVEWITASVYGWLLPEDDRSIPLFEDAVRLARRNKDKDIERPFAAGALRSLGEAYIARKRYADAEPLIKEAVAITRATPFGAAYLPAMLMSLGRINRFLGRLDQEEQYQREAFAVAAQHYGPGSEAAANSEALLAYSLLNLGKIAEAETLAEKALASMRRRFPEPNLNLWTTTATAAYAQILAGHFATAEKTARATVGLFGAKPDPRDTRWHEARGYLGLALAGEKKYAEALPLLEAEAPFFKSDLPFPKRLRQALADAHQAP